MTRRLVYSTAAEADLVDLYTYLATAAGADFAGAYVARLMAVCDGFAAAPARGTMRDDIAPGVRTYGWRRQATIAFRSDPDAVLIIGIFASGRDIDAALADPERG